MSLTTIYKDTLTGNYLLRVKNPRWADSDYELLVPGPLDFNSPITFQYLSGNPSFQTPEMETVHRWQPDDFWFVLQYVNDNHNLITGLTEFRNQVLKDIEIPTVENDEGSPQTIFKFQELSDLLLKPGLIITLYQDQNNKELYKLNIRENEAGEITYLVFRDLGNKIQIGYLPDMVLKFNTIIHNYKFNWQEIEVTDPLHSEIIRKILKTLPEILPRGEYDCIPPLYKLLNERYGIES